MELSEDDPLHYDHLTFLSKSNSMRGYITLLISTIYILAHAQTHYYVNQSTGNDLNTGTSWADAFETVQKALAVISDNDEIWVAQGTYYPDEGGGSINNDRASSFYLYKGVRLYGGFQGTELSLSQRSIEDFPTVLSGDLMQNDGPDFMNNGDNAHHVVTCGNQILVPIIDGFTIVGGNANVMSSNFFLGAGMFILNADPRVVNCRFETNYSIGQGGAMYNSNTETLVESCVFYGNYGINGGGMYNIASDIEIYKSEFIENSSSAGAGIYNHSTQALLEENSFDGNIADTGSPTTSSTGGGVYNFSSSKCTMNRNCFFANYADFGGGVHNSNSSFYCDNGLFSGNHAKTGGGLYTSDSASLINCTFTGNLADFEGGAIRNHLFNTKLENTVIWNNADQNGVGSSTASMSSIGAIPIFTYCLIQNITVDLGGNLDGIMDAANPNYPGFIVPADPLSAPTSAGNARLRQDAKIIDVGNNVVTSQTDHDGLARINGVVDFGAFENPLVNCKNNIVISTSYSPLYGNYMTKNTIKTEGTVIVLSGSSTMLSAPQVQFDPGFSISLGAQLMVMSDACMQ